MTVSPTPPRCFATVIPARSTLPRQLAQRNDRRRSTVPPLPDVILDIIASGGVLRGCRQGYLPAELGDVLRSSAVR